TNSAPPEGTLLNAHLADAGRDVSGATLGLRHGDNLGRQVFRTGNTYPLLWHLKLLDADQRHHHRAANLWSALQASLLEETKDLPGATAQHLSSGLNVDGARGGRSASQTAGLLAKLLQLSPQLANFIHQDSEGFHPCHEVVDFVRRCCRSHANFPVRSGALPLC